ncbi:MAG: hypothetical protein IKZ28_01815 [Clostridia bacterium]|nr:hypothetical protein [Clostridia bacterium]
MTSIGQKIHNRKGEKAKREGRIVDLCVQHMNTKIAETKAERARKMELIKKIDEEILTAMSMGEEGLDLDMKIDEAEASKLDLDTLEKSLHILMSVQDALRRLSVQVQALIRQEWYSYVIRTIPEKKLPKMIRSESAADMMKLRDIALEILEKINDRVMMESKSKEEGNAKIARTQEVARAMMAESEQAKKDRREAYKKEALARAAKVGAMPIPVPADAGASVSAKKKAVPVSAGAGAGVGTGDAGAGADR